MAVSCYRLDQLYICPYNSTLKGYYEWARYKNTGRRRGTLAPGPGFPPENREAWSRSWEASLCRQTTILAEYDQVVAEVERMLTRFLAQPA